ncbi:MAG: hypothetical protein DRJ42_24325, partial [Deltaproteobacteria bacterium]
MSQDGRRPTSIRVQLSRALRGKNGREALGLYAKLEKKEPKEPRWPHRRGDLLRRQGKGPEAIECYERAVVAYAELGFVARAAAMAKVILLIDPSRTGALEKVTGEKARELHRAKGPPPLPKRDRGMRRSSLRMDAVPLKPAADQDDDEVRFLDIDIEVELEEPVEIRVSLTDLETRLPASSKAEEIEVDVDSDDLVFLDLDEEPERVAPERLAQLPSMPLFAEVPEEVLRSMLADAELVVLNAGDALMKAGDPSDALFVMVEGQVEVQFAQRRAGEPILLGEGDIVGESCLLDDVHRRADVIATSPAQALRIPKTTLDALVATHEELGDVILDLLGRRLIANMLQTSPVFASFDPSNRADLAALFELRRAAEGLVLVEANKRSDGLYCTLLGDLELFVGNETRRVGPGIIFGQRTLISQQPSRLGVRCASDVLLLRLPAQRFA